MSPDETKDRAAKFLAGFWTFTDKYEAANPEWLQTTLFQILYQAVENLKRVLEDPAETEVTWDAPLTELRYPVEADWDKVEPVYFHLSPADLEDPGKVRDKFTRSFISVKELYVLRHVTREILVIYKGGKGYYKVPLAVDKRLAKLTKAERGRRLGRILKPVTKLTRFPLYELPHGKRILKAFLVFQFNPCVLNVDEKVAYYPIVIGLEFRGHTGADLDEETRASLLTEYLKTIQELIPKEDWGFIQAPRPEPEARPVTKGAELVKASLHAELQKFGRKPDPRQPGLFDRLLDDSVRRDIEKKDVEVIGIDITPAQEQALHAIQTLLTRTDYKGNLASENIDDKGFKFRGRLPALEFSPAHYLEAHGLKKRLTARGKEEYNAEDRAQALQALVDLARKQFLFVYKREYREKGEPRIDRLEVIAPLIEIMRGWEALTKRESDYLDRGAHTKATDEKLRAIAIRPAPILVQDIDSYFLLKPANYLQEISLKYPWPNRPSKYTIGLINWLFSQAELKRRKRQPLIIETSLETIAYALRMNAWIESRQGKRIRDTINKGYKIAQELGYLLSYGTVQGQTMELERLELNPDKFSRIRGPVEPEAQAKGAGD